MKKKSLLGLAGVLLAALLTGCSASESAADTSYSKNAGMMADAVQDFGYDGYYEADMAEDVMAEDSMDYDSSSYESTAKTPESNGSVTEKTESRKLITTVYMDVETYDFDSLLAKVEEKVSTYGGYIENLSVNNRYDDSRYASYTIRIPENNLDAFTGNVSEESNVVNRSRSVEDVTLSYVDMQSRKEVLRTEEKRLLKMLEDAEDIGTMITVESRLSEVQADIESMESQLRVYDNLIDYSTVHLDINEVKVYTVVEEEEESAWVKMSRGFQHSMEGLGNGLVSFSVWFVSSLPYLLFIAFIIFVIVTIIRLIVKAAKKKSAARKAANPPRYSYYPQPLNYTAAVQPGTAPGGTMNGYPQSAAVQNGADVTAKTGVQEETDAPGKTEVQDKTETSAEEGGNADDN